MQEQQTTQEKPETVVHPALSQQQRLTRGLPQEADPLPPPKQNPIQEQQSVRNQKLLDKATKSERKDWSGEIELNGIYITNATGRHGLVKGAYHANGINTSGLVTRIVQMPSGVVRVEVRLGAAPGTPTDKLKSYEMRYILLHGNGIESEVAP